MGLQTGGVAPNGFKTETGPAPWLADFGLVQHPSADYPPRTRANIAQADGTVIFGLGERIGERGSLLTYNECIRQGKPVLKAPFTVADLRGFIWEHRIRVLNVAGSRESRSAGICDFTRDLLIEAFLHEPQWAAEGLYDGD
jgi:hypothetical protein